MRRFLLAALIATSFTFTPRAADARGSLGANLGFTVHDPAESGDETATLIGVPTQTSPFATLRPGVRVGFTGTKMDHEGFLDLGYDGQFFEGDNIHAMRLGANYQYNFGSGSTHPFVTAGAGLMNAGGEFGDESFGGTSVTFGGGVGVGFSVSQGAGRLRLEARVDKLDEADDDGVIVIEEATVWNIGFGFDLWMR